MAAGNNRDLLHVFVIPDCFHAHIVCSPLCAVKLQRLIGKSRLLPGLAHTLDIIKLELF